MYCFHRIYDFEKTWLDYTNLFSPNDYKKDGKIIYKYINHKHGKIKWKSRL